MLTGTPFALCARVGSSFTELLCFGWILFTHHGAAMFEFSSIMWRKNRGGRLRIANIFWSSTLLLTVLYVPERMRFIQYWMPLKTRPSAIYMMSFDPRALIKIHWASVRKQNKILGEWMLWIYFLFHWSANVFFLAFYFVIALLFLHIIAVLV